MFVFVDGKDGTEDRLVEDEFGRTWEITFQKDNDSFDAKGRARAEAASSRLLWAVGYHADQCYFLDRITLRDDGKLKEVRNVGLKRRHGGVEQIGAWSWNGTPFGNSRELQGLKTMIALINNFGTKQNGDDNVIARRSDELDRYIYYVADLSSSLGKSDQTRGNAVDYAGTQFLKNPTVSGNEVRFAINGNAENVVKGVSPANARWVASLAAQLSDQQITDAFRAAGFGGAESGVFVQAIRSRIQMLQSLP